MTTVIEVRDFPKLRDSSAGTQDASRSHRVPCFPVYPFKTAFACHLCGPGNTHDGRDITFQGTCYENDIHSCQSDSHRWQVRTQGTNAKRRCYEAAVQRCATMTRYQVVYEERWLIPVQAARGAKAQPPGSQGRRSRLFARETEHLSTSHRKPLLVVWVRRASQARTTGDHSSSIPEDIPPGGGDDAPTPLEGGVTPLQTSLAYLIHLHICQGPSCLSGGF